MSRDSMQVDGEKSLAAEKPRPAEAFLEVLKRAGPVHPRPLVTAKKVVAVHATRATSKAKALGAAAIISEALGQARTAMHAHAQLLQRSRAEGQLAQEQKVDGRLLELVAKELSIELATVESDRDSQSGAGLASQTATARGKQKPAALQSVAGPSGAADAGNPAIAQKLELGQATAKVNAALALVERIEAFVKSARPALAVTLGGALNARVEVERTGPGEVALKIQGTRGPPPADDLARIRDAVRAKGLKLSSLSVG